MMKVLIVVHQFFPAHFYGTERLVLNLSKQMQRMGHKVKVLTYAFNEKDGLTTKSGALYREYTYQGVPVVSICHIGRLPPENFFIYDDQLGWILDAILAEEQPDIIHVCHSMWIGEVIRSAKKKEIPVLMTLTDFWMMCPRGIASTPEGSLCEGTGDGKKCLSDCYPGYSWKSKIAERFEQTKEIFSYASRVVAATCFLKLMFESQGHVQDITIIPFGKDYKDIHKKKRTYNLDSNIIIGYLSSLTPHKGAHILIEAFIRVNPKNIRLKIYGDPRSAPAYFDLLIKVSQGHEGIEFCGPYEYEEMPKIFDITDIIAVPSIWWENSPLVLLRAQAHNVPAIVSELGGLSEIITNGKDGFTFNVGDSDPNYDSVKTLSMIIRKISDNPRILNDINAGIRSPPRIEEEAFEYECLYQTIVASKRSSSLQDNTSFQRNQDDPVRQSAGTGITEGLVQKRDNVQQHDRM